MRAKDVSCEFTGHVHQSHSKTYFRWTSSIRLWIVLVFQPSSFVRWLNSRDLVVVGVTDVAADFRNMNPAMFAAESVDQRD